MKFDEIGYWSELKHEIIEKYANAYTTILKSQPYLSFGYIDGFSGAGIHISEETGAFVEGSPLRALNVPYKFNEYHFIDLDKGKIEFLREITRKYKNVYIYNEDCNVILPELFKQFLYKDYRRALCVLDPYGLDLNWEVIESAGKMKTIEIFLNLPVMGMNRSVLWNDSGRVPKSQIARMNALWGDESWRDVAYKFPKQYNLFGEENKIKEPGNEAIVQGFRTRLAEKAGFKYVLNLFRWSIQQEESFIICSLLHKTKLAVI